MFVSNMEHCFKYEYIEVLFMVNDQDLINKYEELQNIKKDLKKVNFKGWGLLIGFFLIGLTVGFLLGGGFS